MRLSLPIFILILAGCSQHQAEEQNKKLTWAEQFELTSKQLKERGVDPYAFADRNFANYNASASAYFAGASGMRIDQIRAADKNWLGLVVLASIEFLKLDGNESEDQKKEAHLFIRKIIDEEFTRRWGADWKKKLPQPIKDNLHIQE